MEVEFKRKADVVMREIRASSLEQFNDALIMELYGFHRDEFKLKFLDFITSKVQKEIDKHGEDKSCRYPVNECPTLEPYRNAFFYIEQEQDKIVDDINIYGTLNRYNTSVFGEQFSADKKEQISDGIDLLLSGQVSLAEGQLDLSEELKAGLEELKELMFVLNKKHWTDNFRGQIWSTIVGLGINPENAESLMTAIEKSIGL
jgi:hypothetical protein